MYFALIQLGLGAALKSMIAAYPKTAVVVMLLLTLAVFNAIVQGMPNPTEKNGMAYRWAFRSLHVLAFNFQYAIRAKFPQYVPASEPEIKETATAAGKE